MIEFFTLMCEHPGVFFMVAVCALIFIGMTYDFILRLFNRGGRKTKSNCKLDLGDEDEPPEDSNVVKPDDPPPTTI